MRSLSLLVLLLFTVVVSTAISPEEMKDLLANGTRQRLKAYNGLYLTDDRPQIKGLNIWSMPRQDWLQDWIIEQVNDNEVVIKSSHAWGTFYVGHGTDGYAEETRVANDGQPSALLTPVKNSDGTWSFKSRENKWLSSHSYYYENERHYVNFEAGNARCEHWKLEPYTPPTPPTPMSELLANGGTYQVKSFNGLYLADKFPDDYIWVMQPQGFSKKPHDWIMAQMNNNEIAIKSKHRGIYVRHGVKGWGTTADVADAWEMFTPVKNADGTWSFQNRFGKFMSGRTPQPPGKGETHRNCVDFAKENGLTERWKLEQKQY